MEIKAFAKTDIDPLDLASLAAGNCYQDKIPEIGKRLNIKDKLFDVGHHTTIQHHAATFGLEGVAVGDILSECISQARFTTATKGAADIAPRCFLNLITAR